MDKIGRDFDMHILYSVRQRNAVLTTTLSTLILILYRGFMINHFRVLGVKETASEVDIKKAYRRLSNQYHPDKLLTHTEDEKHHAGVQLQRVQEAYDILSDPKKRAAFIKDFKNVIVPDPTAAMRELWDQYYPTY